VEWGLCAEVRHRITKQDTSHRGAVMRGRDES